MLAGAESTRRWAGLGVEEFRAAAAAWLAEAAGDAPSDYGAIVPEAELATAVAWQRRLADAGLAGLHWPVKWGGQGLTSAHTAAWLEECARVEVPPFLNMVGLVLTAEALLAYGTDEQKATHLPPLRTGDRVWCQLFSEPDAGSDLAHLRTRAQRSGEGWVLQGEKIWTSNGHVADWGICLARTDPEAPAHAGISCFLVDMGAPGIEIRPVRQMTGASEFDQVVFDEVQLPPEALLGGQGAGWSVAMSTLTHERNHIGALAIRLGLRLDRLVAELPANEVLRDRAVSLWVRGRAVMALGSQTGRLGPAAASLMKLGVAELSVAAADLAADAAGGAAMIQGRSAAELVAAPGAGIAGGSTQIQKTIVGERILRLPREPYDA
jgi:alkylation response protein AidB-like acyl-CoA dehydrogenase